MGTCSGERGHGVVVLYVSKKKGKKKGRTRARVKLPWQRRLGKIITNPPLTFASERGVDMKVSNTCERGGNRSARTNESKEEK
jgi:hypothetical protein